MKVFVTRRVPLWEEVSKPLIDAGHEVEVYPHNKRIEKKELENKIMQGFDAMLCLLTENIDAQLLALDVDKKLKVIANYAVGYDNVDVAEAQKRGIVVTNTPCEEVNASVADFTWTLILALERNLEPAADFAKNVGFKGWEPDIFLGVDLKGKTLGVVGAGRIGSLVAKMGNGFGMRVLEYSRHGQTTLDQVLGESDVVTLHVPLTQETRHMMNSKTFVKMKKGAVLINTARGSVVDENDLCMALKSGQVGGAALDVWDNEPLVRPEFLEMGNVILTPHIASATYGARRAMGQLACQSVVDVLNGKVPSNAIKL